MLKARYFRSSGEAGEPMELPQDPFDGVVHEAVLHQVVKAHLANRRQGNASTKTRAMVAGGNRKVWRQKGTGRARQGSIRAPHWRGGGIVFGPSPRSYHQDIPKKVKALARRSAFNNKALAERLSVIEHFDLDAPKTREVARLLATAGFGERKLLILTDGRNPLLYLSARNLPGVQVLPYAEASAYDVMVAGELLIEAGALQGRAVSEPEMETVHA